jgi:hypothetical protein
MGFPSSTRPTFKFDGKPLERRQRPSDLHMNGDPINASPVYHRKVLRKSVIYLFSPTDIDATVTLTLNEWSLSVVYPVVPIKVLENGQRNRIQWSVRTHQDGSLTTHDTSLDVSYLFWEAEYVFFSHTGLPTIRFISDLSSSIGLIQRFPSLLPDRHHQSISVLYPAMCVIQIRYYYLSIP